MHKVPESARKCPEEPEAFKRPLEPENAQKCLKGLKSVRILFLTIPFTLNYCCIFAKILNLMFSNFFYQTNENKPKYLV